MSESFKKIVENFIHIYSYFSHFIFPTTHSYPLPLLLNFYFFNKCPLSLIIVVCMSLHWRKWYFHLQQTLSTYSVGPYESLPNTWCSYVKPNLMHLATAAVNSWVQWLCHIQNMLFHSVCHHHPLGLTFFLSYIIWCYHRYWRSWYKCLKWAEFCDY